MTAIRRFGKCREGFPFENGTQNVRKALTEQSSAIFFGQEMVSATIQMQ
jgi:hypothetical protein